MKAIVIEQPGGADALTYGDAHDPMPDAGELLVRVRAAGVNRADVLQRMGNYPPPPGASPILGLELAGEVVEAVGDWQVGDRVMAVVTGGGYAELATVPVGMAMPVPADFSFVEAAAIPEAFLTAYLNLFTLGGLQAGETVLIHAGGSGVGTAAIQLAKAANATVFTTASAAKLATCAELGADVTIDYKSENFAERVKAETDGRGVDVILDFVGAPYWADNTASLVRGGRLMLIGFLGGAVGTLNLAALLTRSLTVKSTGLRSTPLDQKTALTGDFVDFAMSRFASGALKPLVDSVYPLSQAADAHRHMEANRNTGKIILEV